MTTTPGDRHRRIHPRAARRGRARRTNPLQRRGKPPPLGIRKARHEPRIAVKLCGGCPVLDAWRDTAELRKKTWGVWAKDALNQFIAAAIERGGAVTEWLRSLTNRGVLPSRLDVRIEPLQHFHR